MFCCCSPSAAGAAPGRDDAPDADTHPQEPDQAQQRPGLRSRPSSAGKAGLSQTETMRKDLLRAYDTHPQWMVMPGPYTPAQKAEIKAKWKALPEKNKS